MLAGKLALAVASLTLVGLVSLGSVSVGVEAMNTLDELINSMKTLPRIASCCSEFERLLGRMPDKDNPVADFGGYTVNQVLSCAWSKDYRQCTDAEFQRRSAQCKAFERFSRMFIITAYCNYHLGVMGTDCALHADSNVSFRLHKIPDHESLKNFERRVSSRSAGTSQGGVPDLSRAVSGEWQAITEDERQKVKLVCQSFTSELERLIGLDGEFKNHCSLLQICLQVARLRVR
jgi:hypothetical protein